MKFLLKNIASFIFLTVALSAWLGCNTATSKNAPSLEAGNVAVVKQNSPDANPEIKSGDFPPAPEGLLNNPIKDLEGKTYTLADKKGKVLLVNLWATWCGPCRNEMPELVNMYQKYKDKDFEVIGLDIDPETPEQVTKFAEQMNLSYPLGYADDKMLSEFIRVTKMQGIPQTILINREGKMTGIFAGGGPSITAKMQDAVEKTINN